MAMDEGYAQISLKVFEVIRKLELRDTRDHRAFAQTHREFWAKHQPVSRDTVDAACAGCGYVWPCGVVRGLIVG